MILGAKLISSTQKYLSTKSNDPFLGVTESPGSVLYRSAQSTLLQHLTDFVILLPRASQYQTHIHKLFAEKSFWEILFFIVPCTSCFLETQDYLPDRNIPNEAYEDIAILSIVCCEVSTVNFINIFTFNLTNVFLMIFSFFIFSYPK